MLAAWLVIYAVGNLVLIADSGLQFRAINRFLAFKSSADCDGRTASFYAAMLRIYLGLAGFLVILVLLVTQLVSPSSCARISGDCEFRRGLYRDDGGHAVDPAVRSGVGPVSRTRALRTCGAAAELGRAGRAARSVDSDCRDRKPVGRHHCVCGDASAHRGLLSERSMLRACFHSCAGRARSILGAGLSASFARRLRSRSRVQPSWLAQSAGAAGQRFRGRSRGRGAMGAHPRRRRTCCGRFAFRPRFPWLPNLATIMRLV